MLAICKPMKVKNSFQIPFVLPSVVSALIVSKHNEAVAKRVQDAIRASYGQMNRTEETRRCGMMGKATGKGETASRKANETTITKLQTADNAPLRFMRFCQQIETVADEASFELASIGGANGEWLASVATRYAAQQSAPAAEQVAPAT